MFRQMRGCNTGLTYVFYRVNDLYDSIASRPSNAIPLLFRHAMIADDSAETEVFFLRYPSLQILMA